jgi:enolase
VTSQSATRIEALTAREILDSRGRPTVEADVRLEGGVVGRASVPSGASTGRHEALELRDRDLGRFGGFGVRSAVRNVREVIAPVAVGRDALDQAGLDAALIDLDGTRGKERLGANALLAVSLATARAAAKASGLPLWRYLADGQPALPLPMVNIVSGGAHAPRGLAFQDFLIIPVGARRYSEALEIAFSVRSATEGVIAERGLSTLKADEGGFGPALERPEQALDLLEEAILLAGYQPGEDVAFAVDVAASQFSRAGSYELPPDGMLNAAELVTLLDGLVARYPVVSIEDGLGEDDWEGWTLLTRRLGKRIQILGDDLFTTDLLRLERGIEGGVANAILVKMNQIGTLTETISVIKRARRAGYATVISARSGETEDPFIADLAVATGAGQIKIGSLAQSERLAKYNQLLRIEEELGPEAVFAGPSALAYRSDTTTVAPGRAPMSG